MTMELRVNEIFETIQGEATYTGTPSIFVRLQGCPVGCPWCDTKHTWESAPLDEIDPEQMLRKVNDAPTWAKITDRALTDYIGQLKSRHVVITGGEPCIYDLTGITEKLIMEARRSVQIETSGTHEIRCHPKSWVTVSPKVGMPGGFTVRKDALLRANEIKMPIGKPDDIETLQIVLGEMPDRLPPPVWLQPLSKSIKATDLCYEAAREHGWQVSIQAHKFIGYR